MEPARRRKSWTPTRPRALFIRNLATFSRPTWFVLGKCYMAYFTESVLHRVCVLLRCDGTQKKKKTVLTTTPAKKKNGFPRQKKKTVGPEREPRARIQGEDPGRHKNTQKHTQKPLQKAHKKHVHFNNTNEKRSEKRATRNAASKNGRPLHD